MQARRRRIRELHLRIALSELMSEVAMTLARSWRRPPAGRLAPPIGEETLRALVLSGAGPISYLQLKEVPHGTTSILEELRSSYFLARLQWSIKRRWAIDAVDVLRSRGIEPIVIKGPIVALLYPEMALRPFGDIDLCVDPDQFETAERVLRECDGSLAYVDLHRGCPDSSDRAWSDLAARSRAIELEGESLTTLAEEDHLRLLALHAMKHGCFRALWLCDIGAALENRTPDFDWELFLSGHPRQTEYAIAAVQLSSELLGADLSGSPLAAEKPLPRWMIIETLRLWASPSRWPGGRPLASAAFRENPMRIARHLAERVPGALESTAYFGAPLRRYPRLPLQILYLLIRLADVPRQFMDLTHRRAADWRE